MPVHAVEGAMNGIGERAGNCSLEEVIMAIKVRKDILNVHTAINHRGDMAHQPVS